MIVDRKYRILAVNPCNGSIHTEKDSVLFNATDPGLDIVLEIYLDKCYRLNCGKNHLESIRLLMERVKKFQQETGTKIPDTDDPCEVDRCIHGKL